MFKGHLLLSLFFSSGAVLAQENVVLLWNDLLLETIRTNGTPPPIATRAMAITHTAMFDAWAAYHPKAVGTRLGGALRRPEPEHTDANKSAAISHAALRAMLDLYPASRARFELQMRALGYDPADNTNDLSKPAGIGNVVAAAVVAYRHNDGSNQLGDMNSGAYSDYTGYAPLNDPDALRDPTHWQPLRSATGQVQNFLTPHWGLVTGFALKTGSQFRPGPPPYFENDLFHERCEDIRRLSSRLTDRQKLIAEYWEDGAGTETPPGHWNRIAHIVSARDRNGIDKDVVLFFALTNAQFDAGVAVWECKRHYDYIRPISAVRAVNAGKMISAWAGPGRGVQMIPGEEWRPYLTTPPFAEYPSGHSAFSAASAEILQLFTGSDNYGGTVSFPVGSSRIEPGVTPKRTESLFWATFSDAADEAGLSRRLGGIHFEDGDIRSRVLGRQVAREVWEKVSSYLGTTP